MKDWKLIIIISRHDETWHFVKLSVRILAYNTRYITVYKDFIKADHSKPGHAHHYNSGVQGESKKSRPPSTFNDIFAWAESFCIKFYTLIGNLYPRRRTDFRLFILTCNEMALILSRSPIIFTVSSLDCSAGNKMQSFSLTEKTLLVSDVD